MTIEDYMRYRARPILTYFERTAPWRAFEEQCLEVLIFAINSSGAVLVGVADGAYVPYVALTVAIAGVCKSFLEFSRLSKQVEQYNAAQRELHNLINKWDGMTRTERRKRGTIEEVVGKVEEAMLGVAQALTDAIRSDQSGDGGGDGDGDGDDDKK